MYQNNCPSCAVYTQPLFSLNIFWPFFGCTQAFRQLFTCRTLMKRASFMKKNSDSNTTPIASLNKHQKSKYSTWYKEITKHGHFVGVYGIHKTCSLDLNQKIEILYVPLATEIVLSLRFKLKELLAIIPILWTTAHVTLLCWGATAVHFNCNTRSKYTIYQWVNVTNQTEPYSTHADKSFMICMREKNAKKSMRRNSSCMQSKLFACFI